MASVAQRSTVGQRRLQAHATRDRDFLRAFLERDRLFAAYAICDLDDREFGRTRWGVALDGSEPVAVALEYGGLAPQPLFVMGDGDGVAAVLREVIRPRTAYLAALPEHLPSVAALYRIEPGPPMVRMWVDRSSFRPAPGPVERMVPADIGELNRLYDLGFTSWLPSEAISGGVYFGIREGGRLIAAAGTHVASPQAGLSVVGNVMTHRDYRGRGFAKVTTSAVTQELLRTSDQVVLNVRVDNPPALRTYLSLGYREHGRFEERLIHRRGVLWDSIMSPLRRLLPQPHKEV